MVLVFWWLLPLGLVFLAILIFFAWRRLRQAPDRLPVAHAERLTALPGYAKALARRRLWSTVGIVSVLALSVGALLAASRPAEQNANRPEQNNRDIMLCLDVSGSMVDTDAKIVDVFANLAQEFHGERLGLVIFDSTAVQVFPLTDDYGYINDELNVALKAMTDQTDDTGFFGGTYSGRGSSLIGDGLATCVNSFPKLGAEQRSRSIVFATDNVLLGKPLFSLTDAAGLATKNSIRVYGINPNGSDAAGAKGAAAKQMRVAVESTGGNYYVLADDAAAKDIVNKVQATEATKSQVIAQIVARDRPELWLSVAGLGLLGLLLAAWRLSR